jgi:hypothetical protein
MCPVFFVIKVGKIISCLLTPVSFTPSSLMACELLEGSSKDYLESKMQKDTSLTEKIAILAVN